MKKFIRENAFVLAFFLFFWLAGLLLVMMFPKESIHLEINSWHTAWFDIFFKYITHLGSGWMILLMAFLFLFVKVRYTIIFLVGNIIITLFVQVGKHLIYPHALRPISYFKGAHVLHLVDGVVLHAYHSFPSGHSATAFGIFVMLILLTSNRTLKMVWLFLVGILPNFSRIYLSQHFLEDVLAGSFIGLLAMILTLFIFEKYFPLCCDFSIRLYPVHKKKK
jgi:membrane-associated phospholipid phosphatase